MQRTIIVCQNYLHFVKKYQRYEKRHSNISAHVSPCFRVKEGDHVIIGQCRPFSKDCEVQCAEGDPSMHICLCQEGIHWNVIGFEVMESFYVSECFVCWSLLCETWFVHRLNPTYYFRHLKILHSTVLWLLSFGISRRNQVQKKEKNCSEATNECNVSFPLSLYNTINVIACFVA